MKKLTLLLLSGVVTFGVQAQKRNLNSTAFGVPTESRTKIAPVESLRADVAPGAASVIGNTGAGSRTGNKGTATPFVTEDFSSGSATALPTGWVRGSSAASAGWRWTKQAASSQYSGSLGVINSTSANNGWLIFDSDSAGGISGVPTIFEGTITSPAYVCTGHTNVMLQFQSYYKKLQDSCWVQVSNNNFTSFTEYQVNENNTLPGNGFSANPAVVRINITAAAGNQASVKIRFRYKNEYAGGTYAWMIDDLSLSDIDPVELSLKYSGMLATCPGALADLSAYSAIPLSLVSSLRPLSAISNNGTAGQANVPISVNVYRNGTSVFTNSTTYPSSPVNGVDSIVEWPATATYTPTTTGNYVAAFNANQTGDGYALNNVDTFAFDVTDTVYITNGSKSAGSYYLHRPNTHSAGEGTNFFGTRFDIPASKADTLTSISVALSSGTTVGTKIIGHIYKLNDNDPTAMTWDHVASTREKTLAAGDISSTSTRVYALLPMNDGLGVNSLVFSEGVYVTAVTTSGAPAGSTVLIDAAVAKYDAPGIVGYYGHLSDAANDGQPTFAVGDGIATGLRNLVPLIRMNFGRYVGTSAVREIPGVTVGAAFPNPASKTVSLPISVKESANVNVTLSNVVGQVLDTQSMGKMTAGASKNATFNTATIANGIYFLTVEANGARSTTRFVVRN